MRRKQRFAMFFLEISASLKLLPYYFRVSDPGVAVGRRTFLL
jgi:hypothetical protein